MNRSITTAVVAAATIIAFMSGPLIRFADATHLWMIGYELAAAAIVVVLSFDEESNEQLYFGIFLFALGLTGLAVVENRASSAAKANDERCWTIQSDLLSARPRMRDPAGAFRALGCDPQGEDARVFVAPTDRESAAGKPLPWGGYPPRI